MEQIIQIEQIKIKPGRQRQDLGDLAGLKTSLVTFGLLNPLVVEPADEGFFYLLAGERRYTSIKELIEEGKWTGGIRVTLLADLDEAGRTLLELDENIKRKDLEWEELVKAISRMYDCFPDQPSQEVFSERTGIPLSTTQKALAIIEHMDNPLVQAAKNISNAYTIVTRINARKMDTVMGDVMSLFEDEEEKDEEIQTTISTGVQHSISTSSIDIRPSSSPVPVVGIETELREIKTQAQEDPLPQYQIQQGDFISFARDYQGAPFNLIHCDFPYGIQHDRSAQGATDTYGTYEDSEDLYKTLVRTLLENKDRLIAPSAHVVCWLSLRFEEWTRAEFAKHGFSCHLQPFIWYKSDNMGIVADKDCGMRNVGEYALVFNRKRRRVCKIISNIFPAKTTKKFHASEKPVPMLDYLFSALVDDTSRVLDPTAGSGTAIQAAMRAKAEMALGLELDPDFASKAKEWLALEKKKVGSAEISLDQIEIDI